MRILLTAAIALSLSACASQDPTLTSPSAPVIVAAATADINSQTKLVCHKEASIGSQMLHTVCEVPQTEAERNATQQTLRNMAPPNSVSVKAPGP
jgi:starvation-inducible outer membrane lipoprotein